MLAVCSISVKAQNIAFQNNFNTDGADGWTLTDHDGNGNNWTLRQNNYHLLAWGGGEGSPDFVLSSKEPTGLFDNWAITPVQDLSYYTGTKLSFSYLKGYMASSQAANLIYVYAATTPNVTDMLANGPIATITLQGENQTEPPAEITNPSIDIPVQYNVANVYFAIVSKNETLDNPSTRGAAIELTEVSITYASILGIDAPVKQTTFIKQNPVEDKLQLQLGNNVDETTLSMKIYNVNGRLVKEARYNEAGIDVNELSKGLYFLTVQDGAGIERLKFIKK